jgi:hypothetical protein
MAKISIPHSVFTALLESVRVIEDIDVLRERQLNGHYNS